MVCELFNTIVLCNFETECGNSAWIYAWMIGFEIEE